MGSQGEGKNPGTLSTQRAARHRVFVGPAERYDAAAHLQFNLLTLLGLRENHTLLDIGCGSLRAGRLFITYLLPGHYFGLEPERWLVEEGIQKELGRDCLALKKPEFSYDGNFTLTGFGREFDFLLAHSIFSHAPPAQIRRCLEQARQCMKPDSLFAATFLEGEENYTGTDFVQPGSVTYQLAWMQETAAAGLACTPIEWFHPNQSWVLLARSENQARVAELTTLNDIVSRPGRTHTRELKSLRQAWLRRHRFALWGLRLDRLLKRIRRRLG